MCAESGECRRRHFHVPWPLRFRRRAQHCDPGGGALSGVIASRSAGQIANLEIARISAERWQNLRKSDSVSQQDTDVRVATWHARQADVQAQEEKKKKERR